MTSGWMRKSGRSQRKICPLDYHDCQVLAYSLPRFFPFLSFSFTENMRRKRRENESVTAKYLRRLMGTLKSDRITGSFHPCDRFDLLLSSLLNHALFLGGGFRWYGSVCKFTLRCPRRCSQFTTLTSDVHVSSFGRRLMLWGNVLPLF